MVVYQKIIFKTKDKSKLLTGNVIERNNRFATPTFTEYFGTFKGVGMRDTVHLLARSDAVGVVGVLNVVKLLKLPPLFPN